MDNEGKRRRKLSHSSAFRESDSFDSRDNKMGRLGGINRHGEESIRHDSYQDDQYKDDYDPSYEDEYGRELSRWSNDVRSEASKEDHFGRGPRGYYRSDQKMYEDVCENLTRNPNLDASQIEVTVMNRCVYLDGYVLSRKDKRLAESLSDKVSGVEDVINRIKIFDIKYDGYLKPIKEII